MFAAIAPSASRLRGLLSFRAAVLLGGFAFGLASAPHALAQSGTGSAPAALRGSVERTSFHATSLEGNPLGDPAEQPVLIYLPPSYRVELQRRYPVVYLLHGLG